MTPRAATLLGLTAILMWSLLAALTVASGSVPAFQLAAMTFAVGATVGFLTWIGRRNATRALRQLPLAWLVPGEYQIEMLAANANGADGLRTGTRVRRTGRGRVLG